MMLVTIYNDNHWFAPNSIQETISQFKGEWGLPNVYSIGDQFDLRNCDPAQESMIRTQRDQMISKNMNNQFDGNHEVKSTVNNTIFLTNNLNKRFILAHGDFESWGAAKAIAYREQPAGASKFKRSVIVPLIELFEKTIGRTVNSEFIAAAEALALNTGCKVYIGGHLHPKKQIDVMSPKGIRVIVLKRGRNVLDLDAL